MELTKEQIEKLEHAVRNLSATAERSLSKQERNDLQDAQQSVVEARRNAETHEGLLIIC
jgi:hypothetical protein